MEAVKPGDTYKRTKKVVDEKGNESEEVRVEYEVLPEHEWFCRWVPVGRVVSEVNKGHKVVLVNAPRKAWSRH